MLALVSDTGITMARDDAAAVLRSSHQRVTRVSILDDNFNAVPGLIFTGERGYALEGSVTGDDQGYVRRTMSLTVANPDGIWTPVGEGSAFYWDKMVRVERGVRIGGLDFYAPQGVFQIDSPSTDRHTLSVSGSDRIDRATESEFTTPTSYVVGERVGDVIRDILETAGVGSQFWSVDDGGSTLGAIRAYEIGDERLPAAMSLATAFSLEVFADANGYMIVQPKRDPMGLPSAWAFTEGSEATYMGISKRWSRDRFYNHVYVSNDTSDEDVTLLTAEASVTDPSNPLRIAGPMGDKLFKYVSSMITTQAQADAVAASLLWEHAIIEEEISLEHVPNPTIEVGDAVTIIDAMTRTDDKYAISNLTIPLGGGSASLSVKKIRRLS